MNKCYFIKRLNAQSGLGESTQYFDRPFSELMIWAVLTKRQVQFTQNLKSAFRKTGKSAKIFIFEKGRLLS